MIRTTKVCEQRDSINQAVWNKPSFVQALKTNNIVKKVAKSKRELTGPKVTINLLMKEISHRFGLRIYSSSTLSVVNRSLRSVIKQVV